jgi:N-acetyl-anhydromuramyl-L-alanine amidase AmpD
MLYPRAIWKPVPNFGYPQGTHGQLRANGPRGSFWHDNQGWRNGAFSTFCDPDRGSAHINFNFDGPPWQFVDFDDAAWHAGGRIPTGHNDLANLFFWGFEFEGGYPTPTPITDYQIAEAVKCTRWLADTYGFQWKAVRREDLWEHREVYPTSCPNDRIPWPKVIAALKEQPMDWKAAKLELIDDHQDEDAAFWEWVHSFPETQQQKDNAQRQGVEDSRYALFKAARQRFTEKQTVWRP